MSGYEDILRKLESFSRKYYTKKLIQGSLLFLALGLLFWFAITSIELLFWLNEGWRLTLFLVFLVVELLLLYKFIVIPIFYLFRVKKGLTHKEASKLIGLHFPTVEDKLFNLLELLESPKRTDLLTASIEQRAKNLSVLPFNDAVDFRESSKYAKYLIIPLFVLLVFWISGNINSLFDSHSRVMNYDLAYERPAPFSFVLLNSDLTVLDNEALTIEFALEGDLVPENVSMVLGNESLLMRRQGNRFSYTMQPPFLHKNFYVSANGWNSKTYEVESIRTPSLIDFKMRLDYPNYLNKPSEVISGSGNAVLPEGTNVTWEIKGHAIDEIKMSHVEGDELFRFEDEQFLLAKNMFANLDYAISTSNEKIKNFESLQYAVNVIKDASPKIKVTQILDSLNPNQSFFTGQLSDDYGLQKLSLVYYEADNIQNKRTILLERLKGSVHQFYYTFPTGIEIVKGKNYKLYFEILDNDGLRGGKSTKSEIFNSIVYQDKELKNRELDNQDNLLNKLDNSLRGYRQQQETLSKINEKQKEGEALNFEEKSRIKDFIQKQKEQESLMEKFSKQLNESLNKNEDGDLKKLLQERLERQELEARKNEKLLKELDELADKIEKDELKKRLEELSKKQSSNARNLEQILELTKRYYVTEKASQLAKELDALSKEQDKLSEELKDDEGERKEDVKEQSKLNVQFEEISKNLDELREDNKGLKKPLDFDINKKQQNSIKEDQNDAMKELQQEQSPDGENKSESSKKASQKQKSAAQKMQELSQSLQQSATAGGGSSDTEDAEMLRQILDNLVTFSFKQEQLFEWVEESDVDISQYGKMVRDQKELRSLFEHVDDSLFSLSLRRAELSEFVNEQITEVYYNIDKSLESLAENQVFQGASYQQYVINATNSLSDFLANILDNMQQNMQPGQGQGQGGQDFQLPDIIQGQKGLQEKVNSSGQQGKSGQSKEGEADGKGEKSGKGDKGGEGNENQQKGNTEGDSGGEGTNGQEQELGFSEVYEIYKEQQLIRQQLEKQLEDMIEKSDRDLAKKLIRQMEDFENDLLENGITQRTRNKVNVIQHQLLKLENAALKQGERKERESTTNQDSFNNPVITRPSQLPDNRSDIEILNRQALPLRRQFDKKVKEYFNND